MSMNGIFKKLHLQGHFQSFLGRMDFDFTWSPGDILLLEAANGTGKSSFCHYLKLNQSLYFNRQNFLRVGFMDQFPLAPLGDLRPVDLLAALKEQEHSLMKSTETLIDYLGLKEKMSTPIRQLSGGENQLVKILALFAYKTDCFIMDEPTNSLDEKKMQLLKNLVLEVRQRNPSARFFIIDHGPQMWLDIITGRLHLKNNKLGSGDGN